MLGRRIGAQRRKQAAGLEVLDFLRIAPDAQPLFQPWHMLHDCRQLIEDAARLKPVVRRAVNLAPAFRLGPGQVTERKRRSQCGLAVATTDAQNRGPYGALVVTAGRIDDPDEPFLPGPQTDMRSRQWPRRAR